MPDPGVGPYDVWDRPACWVLHGGQWCPGRVLQWFRGDDGWSAMVRFESGGLQYEHEVPAERLADGGQPAPGVEGGNIAPPWDEQGPPWLVAEEPPPAD